MNDDATYTVRASTAIPRTELTDDQVVEDWANGPVTVRELNDLVDREWEMTDLDWVEPDELHATLPGPGGDRVRFELVGLDEPDEPDA